MGDYKYVTRKDINSAVSYFQERGFEGDNLVEAAGQYADELEFKRFDQQSNQSRSATFAKSAIANTPGTVSSLLRGVGPTLRKHFKFAEQPSLENLKGTIEAKRAGTTFTPEPTDFSTSLGDRAFNFVADNLDKATPPLWQRQSQELAAGSKNPLKEGSGQAWAAMLGQQAPLMASMVASSLATKKLMPGIPTFATKVGPINPAALLGGFEAMSSMETGGFIEATEELGLDSDIQEKWASTHGPISGGIEQFQMLGLLAPWKELGKSASTRLLLPFLKAAGKELSIAALEGLEETFQGKSFNTFLDKAVAEQNERNQAKGLPDIDVDHAESVKQNLAEGFTAGFGISMIMRGGPASFKGAKAINQKVNPAARVKAQIDKALPDFVAEKGPGYFEAIKQGATKEELTQMAAVENPRIAPHGSVQAASEAQVNLTPEERREVFSNLRPADYRFLANNYKVPLTNEDGTSKSQEQLREEILETVGAEDEGPRSDGTVVKPILNPTPEAEVKRSNVLDRFLRDMVKTTSDADIEAWFPEYEQAIRIQEVGVEVGAEAQGRQEARRTLVNAMRWKALQAVVGDKIANQLLPLSGTRLNQATKLNDVLRRDQYAAYTDNLEGTMRDKFKTISGKQAENEILTGLFRQLPVKLDQALMSSPIKLRDGSTFEQTQIPENAHIPWYRKYAALLPSLEDIESRTGLPMIELDRALFEGRKMSQRLLGVLKLTEKHLWTKIPTPLQSGIAGKRMSALVHWLLTDSVQKTRLARTLKMPRNTKAILKWVAESGEVKDQDEILRHAKQLRDDYRDYYKWFTQNNLIAPDQFHRDYAPVIYKYMEDSSKGDMQLVEWINSNKEAKGDLGQLLRGLSKGKIEKLADLADTVSSWDRKKFQTPGSTKGFMEYARVADKSFMQDLVLEEDIRTTTDIYTRKAVQRMVFGDMIPAASAVASQANRVLTGESRKRFNAVLGNYLESLMGVPDTGARMLARTNVPQTVTRNVVNVVNKGVELFNKSPLSKTFHKMEELDPEGKVNARDAMDAAITYLYASTLGMPMNFTSPIKNLTQGLLVAGAVGTKRYLQGLHYMFKPGVMKQLKDMDLRLEFTEQPTPATGRAKWAEAAKGMLALYRMSDMINVYSSASAGLLGWDMINENMSDSEILGILFKGDKPKGLNDAEVMKPENSIKSNLWSGVISKPVGATILDLIRSGKSESAKRLYVQYLVNMSQWRYGAGGTPGYLRNSFMRATFMFTSWSANYGDYMQRINPVTGRPGMFHRFAQVAALQVLLASMLGAVGFPAWKWILAGPFPDEFLPTGPLAQILESIWKITRGTAVGLTGEIVPGGSEEDRKKNWTMVKRQLEDLFK